MNSISLFALSLGLISLVISMKYIALYEKLNKHTKQLSVSCGNSSNQSSVMLSIQNILDLSDKNFEELLKNKKDDILNILQPNKSVTSTTPLATTSTATSTVQPPVSNAVITSTDNTQIKKPEVLDVTTVPVTSIPSTVTVNTPPPVVATPVISVPTPVVSTLASTSNSTVGTTPVSTVSKTAPITSNKSKNPVTPTTTSSKSKKGTVEKFEDFKYKTTSQRGIDSYNFTNLINDRQGKDILDTDVGMDEDVMIDKTLQYIYKFHDVDMVNETDENDKNFVKRNMCLVNHDNKNYCFNIKKIEDCKRIGKIVNDSNECNYF